MDLRRSPRDSFFRIKRDWEAGTLEEREDFMRVFRRRGKFLGVLLEIRARGSSKTSREMLQLRVSREKIIG